MKKLSTDRTLRICIALSLLTLFTSSARGQWVQSGLPGTVVTSVIAAGDTLYAGGSTEVFISTDNGTTWTGIGSALPGTGIYSLAARGTSLFAAHNGGSVSLTTNNGAEWTTVATGLPETPAYSGNVLAFAGTDLFAGNYGEGVFLSTNNGASWSAANTGLPVQTYTSTLAVNNAGVFAGTNHGVYLSTDNGGSWTKANTGVPDTLIQALATKGSNIFAGTVRQGGSAGGVYLSTDNGAIWTGVNNGLPGKAIASLAVHGENLFAGVFGGGAFLSTDNGTSWVAISEGLPQQTVYNFMVGSTTLFAATIGGGIWSRPLAELGVSSVPRSDARSNAVEILPNPATGVVVVNTPFAGTLNVTVSNPLGESVMLPLESKRPSFSLDLSALESGTYYLTITSAGSVVTRMIVRE